MGKRLIWNTDTQKDFVNPEGKLYVHGAEKLKPKFSKILQIAKEKEIQVVSTADWHHSNSKELSHDPDFITTFPEHCMAQTEGAMFVSESTLENPVIFDWDINYNITDYLAEKPNANIVIRKDIFDVFAGNPNTLQIIKFLNPEEVFVFGVTTNVCVDYAVMGLVEHVKKVYVVEDAIKELPNIPLPFEKWKAAGVIFTKTDKLAELIS